METPAPGIWDRLAPWLDPLVLWAWLMRPRVRLVLAWMLAVTTAAVSMYVAWVYFNTSDYTDKDGRIIRSRLDGNNGHVAIDFGGQWLMGRMLVEGHGRQLYNRDLQREVLKAHYPREMESPDQDKSDTDQLMDWLMGSNTADEGDPYPIGGPLYPPINAFYFYPLGLLEPRTGYRIAQAVNLLLTFVAGWGIQRLSRGNIWCPVAAFFIMMYPGFSGSLHLGQNATLTLALLVWGWVYVVEGKEGCAGAVWGLLAFKPVWALSFLLYPVLTRRWRMAATMCGMGLSLILMTLPVVGIDSWRHWLKVGRIASEVYDYDENWITLSRDLLSVPRRYLLDFDKPLPDRLHDDWPRKVIGWAALGLVFEMTVRVCTLRRRQARETGGFPAAFLLISCWLLCFHFMYYDALLTVLPLMLLFLDPADYFRPRLLLVGSPGPTPAVTAYYEPALADRDSVTRAMLPPLPSADDERPAGSPGEPYPDLLSRLGQFYPLAPLGRWSVWVVNRVEPLLVLLTIYVQNIIDGLGVYDRRRTPWNLFGLLLIWLYCFWCWLRTREKQPTQAPPEPSPEKVEMPATDPACSPG